MSLSRIQRLNAPTTRSPATHSYDSLLQSLFRRYAAAWLAEAHCASPHRGILPSGPNPPGGTATACALPFRSLLSRRRFLDATGVRHWHWSTACIGRCRDQTPLPGMAVARLITTAIPEQVALIPAAYTPASSRNAVRSLRSIGLDAERSVQRPPALDGHPNRDRCRFIPADRAWACREGDPSLKSWPCRR